MADDETDAQNEINPHNETDPKDEPVTDVENELSNVSNELNSLSATQPLRSTALNAQLQKSLKLIASQSAKSSMSAAMRKHMSAIRLINTQRLQSSIAAASGLGQLRKTLRLSFTPPFRTLTRAETYDQPDPPKSFYSPAMTSTSDYFSKDEIVIESFEKLNMAISSLISKVPDLELVWRGHRSADWGIHNALFRRLLESNGVKAPSERPRDEQPYPDEAQMVAAECEMLRVARTDWRFDGVSAMETFARIQHAGGPTRLLDVTKNPFIGAWFAVEESEKEEYSDGRLIAFATNPVPGGSAPTSVPTRVELDQEWGNRTPAWHD